MGANAQGYMQKSHEDRLNAGTYRGDAQCRVRLAPDPRDENCEPTVSSISVRLLARLRHLAIAYELPLLGRLPISGSFAYPEIQLASMEDELAFLFDVVSDSVLLEAITPIRRMITRAAHDPRGWSLVVEVP